jgi:tetratricopeptide (TPR) repeat protein
MAQRALELDSRNTTALMAIGMTHYYGTKNLATARIYMERALAINPNDTTLLGQLAWIEILTGDIEKGFEYADRVRELDPTPPLFLYNAVATGHYLRGEYEMALLELSNRVPSSDAQAEILRAASLGMLGRRDEARQVLDELIEADPQSPQRIFREFVNTEVMNELADGLAKAGLQMELPLPRQGNPKNN